MSKLVYINILIILSFDILSSNLITTISKICKEIIVRVVALVSKL